MPGIGSWEGRGAKPPDFEPPGSLPHGPKWAQIDHPKSRLSAENCDFLITSGWKYKKGMQTTLAHLMAKRAELFHHIPFENIMMETSSKDTVGEAVFLRQNFQNVQISKLIIVTSNWHQKRAREIFKFVLSELNIFKMNLFPFNSKKAGQSSLLLTLRRLN